MNTTALLVIDVQVDFCAGGELPAQGTQTLIDPLNNLITQATANGLAVYATRDWHPPDHGSFVKEGGEWAIHCIQDSPGASFHPRLLLPPGTEVVSKGTDPGTDGYSAFDETFLAEVLRASGIRRVVITGIATDYCVRATALDAIQAGFKVTVLSDLIRAVDLIPGDGERSLQEIVDAGGQVLLSSDWLKYLSVDST